MSFGSNTDSEFENKIPIPDFTSGFTPEAILMNEYKRKADV